MSGYCLYCDVPMEGKSGWEAIFLPQKPVPICVNCSGKLAKIEGDRCEKCSRPLADLPDDWVENGLCLDCIRWEKDSDWQGIMQKNTSLYLYNDFLKEVMARFKYRGDYVLALIFAEQMRQDLALLEADLYVPIPLSAERLSERGFNQSAALIETAGQTPADLLIRTHSEKQSKKTRRERLKVGEIFTTEKNITGKSIVLVDDIYTTGATLHAAGRALVKAGAKNVQSFTVARG